MKKIQLFIQKKLLYEFWPYGLFYFPMVPVWLYFSLKNKSLAYFTLVNPTLKFGGFTDYSKYDVIKNINSAFIPKTFLLTQKDTQPMLKFPFIAKPNIGERGNGVVIIPDEKTWKNYLKAYNNIDVIVQELVKLPMEFGVFYIKFPSEKTGKILSITGKKFLSCTGNNQLTLRNFINNHSRACYRKEYLFEKYEKVLDEIIPLGKTIILEPIGNHNRGTEFTDASHLITPKLTETLDEIALQIGNFYYGRFDIKSSSEAHLQNGIFTILEVNGANSEATHIYDQKYTIIKAYQEVYRHLAVQQKIAKEVHKLGYKYPTFTSLLRVVIPKFFGK